jgi:hypothetical protein
VIIDVPADLVDNVHSDINDWIPAFHILLFVLIKMESNRIYTSTNELECLQQLEILVNVPISKIRSASLEFVNIKQKARESTMLVECKLPMI